MSTYEELQKEPDIYWLWSVL